MYEIKCTAAEWSTILTALKFEAMRAEAENNENARKMLESALSAVMAALGNSSRRV